MQIRVGFEMEYQCRDPTPMVLALSIHYSRASDLVRPDYLVTSPAVPVTAYRDLFGNWCSRLVAPPGRFVLRTDAVVNDSGLPDVVATEANTDPGRTPARVHAGLSAGQPLLRDGTAVRHRMEAVRQWPDGLGSGAGDLRLRSPAYRVRLPACAQHAHCVGGLPERGVASAATTPISRSPSAAA